ncbi:voltage-gated potassium channel [Aureococcus anophagefferens]|nr:voltage-gated potassium channel [Aureococcus anophagefferens]
MFACASPDEPEPGFCLGEVKPVPEKKKPRRGRSRERPKARRKEAAADEAPPRIDVKIDAAVPPAAVDGDDPKRSLGRKNVSERVLRVGRREKLVHLAENLEAAPKHVALSASELIEEGGGGAETSRPLLRLDESQVEFPKLLRRACEFPIVDPRHTLEWDVLMLVLITYVMTVTPFELAFVRAPSVREVIYQQRPKYVWMFLVNKVVDGFFVIDIFVSLHTAYFDNDRGAWITDKLEIAKRYAQSWLLIDVLSVVPYEFVPLDRSAGILKMVKLVHLLKLLRVARQPRIMAKLAVYITMSAAQQIVCKFFVGLVALVHLSACALRITDQLVNDDCHVQDHSFEDPGDENCPDYVLLRLERTSIWRQYVYSLKWALQTLLGDLSFTANIAEEVLALVVALVGVIVLAFLVGDMCNALTNMDPVGNDYRLTLDTLNSYLEQSQMPKELRFKLREYMGSTEGIFRENYNKGLLARLSPGLTAIVAHHNLGGCVRRLSFYNYALQHVYGLRVGETIAVFDELADGAEDEFGSDDHGASAELRRMTTAEAERRAKRRRSLSQAAEHAGAGFLRRTSRPAKILAVAVVADRVAMAVRYEDTGAVERGVAPERVDSRSYGNAALHARVAKYLYERDQFVVELARVFETRLFMPRDVLVSKDLSLNDVMFSITMGKIAVWGRRAVNPILDFTLKRVHDTIGDDICMLLVGSRKARRRHYAARAVSRRRPPTAAASPRPSRASTSSTGPSASSAAGSSSSRRSSAPRGVAAPAAGAARGASGRRRSSETARAACTHRLVDACGALHADAPPPKAWMPLVEPLRLLDDAFRAIDRGDDCNREQAGALLEHPGRPVCSWSTLASAL